MTHVKLSDNLGNTVWPRIKTYILDHNPIAANTMETLEKVKDTCLLPSPELYIIVNGKGKVVWCSLVDVNDLTAAVQKVQQINWLYKDIDEQSLDQVTKQVKEVTSNTTSTMLVKATKEDVAKFPVQYHSKTWTTSCQLGQMLTSIKSRMSRKANQQQTATP